MGPAPLPPELSELAARLASEPHGLALLRGADLECVAVKLGVHPLAVLAAREQLATREGRIRLAEGIRQARIRNREERRHRREVPQPPAPPREPEGLIEAARRHRLGLPFLLDAPLETVAVTFRVHPRLVLQARTLLRQTEPGSSPGAGR
jgi:hypothetical protein